MNLLITILMACWTVFVFDAGLVEAGAWKQNMFIITYWFPPPATNEMFSTLASEGFNLIWAPESKLDSVQSHGLRAMLQDDLLTPGTLDNPEKQAKLDALITRVKNHPVSTVR